MNNIRKFSQKRFRNTEQLEAILQMLKKFLTEETGRKR